MMSVAGVARDREPLVERGNRLGISANAGEINSALEQRLSYAGDIVSSSKKPLGLIEGAQRRVIFPLARIYRSDSQARSGLTWVYCQHLLENLLCIREFAAIHGENSLLNHRLLLFGALRAAGQIVDQGLCQVVVCTHEIL